MGRINQRLNGLNPLSYLGDNSYQPPEFVTDRRVPTTTDVQNFQLGTIWLNTTNTPPGAEDVWMLVSQASGVATWVNFAAGALSLESLTGNSGGTVFGDPSDNINVVGDGTTINVVGVPGTHTLTISAVGSGMVSTLTGNSGGAVSPTAGNINVLGTGVITVVGNPGASTLTITPSGSIASSFITNPATGTATPVLGVLTFAGTSGVTVSAAGSTVTITADAAVAESFPTDSGTATPAAHVLNILGGTAGRDINTTGSGNTVRVHLNNTITVGDLSVVTTGNPSVTLTSGDLTISGTGVNAAGNINIPSTTSDGRQGIIKFGGTQFIHNFGSGNGFFGTAGNLTLTTGSAVNNTGVGNTSLAALTTGASNVGLGAASLQSCTTGSNNAAFGPASLQSCTTSGSNSAIGGGALNLLATGSGQNVALGLQAGNNLLTGTLNTLIGSSAGSGYTGAESNNIIIGPITGTVGESNVLRAGNTGSAITKTFIEGIRGITTTVNDAIAVLIDSAGQLGTVSSSIRFKENVEDMADHSSALMNLRPVVFNFKDDIDHNLQTGLIAEEVLEVMPKLVVSDEDGLPLTIKYHDLGPLLLNELQKLAKRVEELESKLSNCCQE